MQTHGPSGPASIHTERLLSTYSTPGTRPLPSPRQAWAEMGYVLGFMGYNRALTGGGSVGAARQEVRRV